MIRWLRGLYAEPWFFWVLAGCIFNQTSANLLRPVTSYKALEFGVDAASLGALSALYSFGPLLIALRIGRLVDRRGEVPFLIGGTLTMAASGLVMAAADSPAVLYLGLGGLGVGQIIAVVAVMGMVARGEENSYDRRFSAFSFCAAVGQGVGPAIGGVLVGSGSLGEINVALMVGGLAALLALPTLFLVPPPPPKRHAPAADGKAPPAPSLMTILRSPGIIRALIVSATVLSSIDILIIYLPALGEERLWPASLVGALLGVRALSTMTTRVFLARLAARYGRPRLLKGSMAIAAVALVALPFVDSEPLLFLIMTAGGAGLGIGQPMTMAWVASVAAPGTRATALAVRLLANRVGQVALPILAGSVAAFSGAGGVLTATGLVMGASLAAVYGGLTSSSAAATPATSSSAPPPPAASG